MLRKLSTNYKIFYFDSWTGQLPSPWSLRLEHDHFPLRPLAPPATGSSMNFQLIHIPSIYIGAAEFCMLELMDNGEEMQQIVKFLTATEETFPINSIKTANAHDQVL
ncbi:hypothetical protein GWI33_020520 [Rhynchophorus ferrugineus]|uniref:Uncharacterized protein n=1 Tax=Rhynchophorus ferrugineus TaxID=354439 RepID=A0A834HPD6_RHYFE|nr:hypothetical protein GWI33_020520 [Rhynchophorus ferrugineus]